MNENGMVRIGKAVGTYFPGTGPVLIGWDPRKSSKGLAESATKGLIAVSSEVRTVGIIPTPGLAYLTRQRGVKASIMITASHNPYTDNGVKVFLPGGRKLSDKDQDGLNDLIRRDIPEQASGRVSEASEAVKTYEKFLVDAAGDVRFKGLKIALDSANGATSGIAKRVFKALGADVTAIYDKPDGRNINVKCGATDPMALQAAVLDKHLDAGAAFDGDGDRVILVDSKGRQLTGDHILYILAVAGGHEGVVATIMSNLGLESALKESGITLERTPVGDRSVLAALDSTGFKLGGEQSGHIIMSDLSPTGDGLLAAIRTLSACISADKPLAEWHDELKLVPQALVSIPFPDKHLLESRVIQDFLDQEAAKLSDRGRLNVRASGTEPVVRIMVEAPGAEAKAKSIGNELARLAGRGA